MMADVAAPNGTENPLAWFCAELARLRADAGGPTLRELSGIRGVPSLSQLSEIFTGKIRKPPDRDVVRAVVTACLEHGRGRPLRGPSQVTSWLARYDDLVLRLEQHRPPQPARAAALMAPVSEWNPFALGVHHAITVNSANLAETLTPYVPRSHDVQLRRLLNERRSAVMAVLVGESSTGKTRGMLEAVRACVPDWPVAHPPDAESLVALIETLRAPVVLWLNETQRYLDGPSGPAAAQALHRLLSMPPGPVIVLGSMWLRQHWERLTEHPGDGLPDAHQQARELLLGLAYRIDVPPTFDDPVARQALDRRTKQDHRLTLARDTALTGRVIQVLAGGVELANLYEHPTDPYGHAVLTAAIDARRLGFRALLPAEFLREAAPGYLAGPDRSTPAARSGKWFVDALTHAENPVHGVAALTADRTQEGMGEPDGFQLHDYLDQHGRLLRRAVPVPATTWEGLVAQAKEPGDLDRLVEEAASRALYRYASAFYVESRAHGSVPPEIFNNYLERAGLLSAEEAAAFNHDRAELSRSTLRRRRNFRLANSGQRHVDIHALIRWLKQEERQDEIESVLRYAMVLDITDAYDLLVGELERAGRSADVEALRREAFAAGRSRAADRLADWLNAKGRHAEAEDVLRQAVSLGDHAALYRLLNLLHTSGRDNEIEQALRDAINAGHAQAAGRLTDLLCSTRRFAEAERTLRHAILIGHSSAVGRLAAILNETDRQAEATQLWRYGLTAEGETAPAW
jgi:hypothetical protein